jgi:hypothetical protein
MNYELYPHAQDALRKIRALRGLPETISTINAERKVLKQLNLSDTLAVALELQKDEEEANND